MTKNAVPITSVSSHSSRIRGTGTSVGPSACITRNSRSTACADANSTPGGFFRST